MIFPTFFPWFNSVNDEKEKEPIKETVYGKCVKCKHQLMKMGVGAICTNEKCSRYGLCTYAYLPLNSK